MKIKYGNVENFYKMYNEMQGVSFKVRKIKNGERVQVHNFTYYIKVLFFIGVFIILFPLITRIYNSFIKILITQVVPILWTGAILWFGIYFWGYYLSKKRLEGEVNLKKEGLEDKGKDGLVFFAPWNLIDFVYFGKYGVYFFVRKRIIIYGDNSKQKEIRKYFEKNKMDVLIYGINNK